MVSTANSVNVAFDRLMFEPSALASERSELTKQSKAVNRI